MKRLACLVIAENQHQSLLAFQIKTHAAADDKEDSKPRIRRQNQRKKSNLKKSNFHSFLNFVLADEFDAYIIVSFVNATLVLSIGETVEEVTDSGFLGTTPTLSCSALGDDAVVQVYPEGIRHIRSDKRVNEWKAPGKKTVMRCAVNRRQVVIALSGGELVYFEMDPVSIIF
jgi:hypothetical protein